MKRVILVLIAALALMAVACKKGQEEVATTAAAPAVVEETAVFEVDEIVETANGEEEVVEAAEAVETED